MRGLKFCWNKSQQWHRAAVELWLCRHTVNRCATLCPISLQIKLFEKYFNRVYAVTLLNNVQMAPLYCVALNWYVPVSHINPRKTLNFMNSPHSTHLHSASGFVLCMLICWSLRRNEAICCIISLLFVYPLKHRFVKYDIRFGRSIRNQFRRFKQQRETGISAKLSVL